MNADMKWLDNPEVFRVNQLEAHSDHCYYLDYSDMKKEKNPLFQSLNGQWEFSYSKNVKSRPVNFYEETFDASGFDKIMVPGHIELAGYDKIRYINTMYPWEGKEYHRGAYSMEVTGAEKGMFSEAEYNPVGSYIKYFDLDKSMCGKRIHICFEGVEEAMYLWLNGQFVGYAEDSFTPSEFDLTPYIKEKGNVLAVQVHKMSTAAFLEDQDFFRFFGIFRNVTLKAIPDVHMEDVWFKPVLNQDNVSGSVTVSMKVSAPDAQNITANFILKDREENLVAENANKVIDKINKLDRTITKNDENEILEARNAYNSLNDEAKSLVKNLDILERAERKSKVINLIDKIGRDDNKNDTVENRVNKYIEDVKKAKEAYDTLSEEEKNTISPLDREFLNGALVTVEQLNTEARDKAIAEKLVERISKLKSYEKYTQLDEKRAIAKEVYDIRGAYEGLTYTAKKIVTQEYLDILKKAELKILNSVGDLL